LDATFNGTPKKTGGVGEGTGSNEKSLLFSVTLEDLYSYGTCAPMAAHAKRYSEVTVFGFFALHENSFSALP